MTKHANQKTSVSALMGAAVIDAQGGAYGRVREVAVAPSIDASHVFGMVLRLASAKRGDRPSLVPVTELQAAGVKRISLGSVGYNHAMEALRVALNEAAAGNLGPVSTGMRSSAIAKFFAEAHVT